MRRLRLTLLLLLLPALLPAQEAKAPKTALALEEVRVEPGTPGPDTLCRLSVVLKSSGSKKASALVFRVRINGQDLPVYQNQVFYQAVDPGATATLRLHNFWSTETSRPLPKDGKLTVEVTLAEARWMEVQTKDGAEVWTPAGAVEGLPVAKSVTLTLAKAR